MRVLTRGLSIKLLFYVTFFCASLFAGVDAKRLLNAIANEKIRVAEFRFIQEEAKRLGIRVWLFGGSASSFASYVKWDLQRKDGALDAPEHRFDYDYTNIFRSTQDVDIVIDGSVEQAVELEKKLRERFPHFQGNRSVWEVRLLKTSANGKDAILENPDFANQHTDSQSTGLIEISDPQSGEAIVRDARAWNDPEPGFLHDVANGEIRFYHSEKHFETKRAKEGLNPEIFSVVRYLTKLYQYGLTPRAEDRAKIKAIIDEFDPARDLSAAYTKGWMEKNGKKLLQHALDLERAVTDLDNLGLKKKLIEIRNDPNEKDSLAWWLSREPLRTNPMTKGGGRTARELGIDIVAHETVDFLAFESITRAPTGEPNVFVSRDGKVGEAARYGQGFYARIGKNGARGTGFTIRFTMNPDAVEGRDFFVRDGDYVIVLNRAAIRVVPESLNLGPVEYFRLLNLGDARPEDGAILEKLRRRIAGKIASLSQSEVDEIHKIVTQDSKSGRSDWVIQREWEKIPQSKNYPRPMLGRGLYEEIGEIRKKLSDPTLTSGAAENLAKTYFSKAANAEDVVELCNGFKRRENDESWNPMMDRVRVAALAKLLQLEPNDRQLARFIQGAVFYKTIPVLVEQALLHAKDAGQFLRIATYDRSGMHDDYSIAIDQAILKRLDHFISLKPTASEMKDFQRLKLYFWRTQLDALEGLLPKTKTVKDFRVLADYNMANAGNENLERRDNIVLKNVSHLASLRPDADDIAFLKSRLSWLRSSLNLLKPLYPLLKEPEEFLRLVTYQDHSNWTEDTWNAHHNSVVAGFTNFVKTGPSGEQLRKYLGSSNWSALFQLAPLAYNAAKTPKDFLAAIYQRKGDDLNPSTKERLDELLLSTVPHFLSMQPSRDELIELVVNKPYLIVTQDRMIKLIANSKTSAANVTAVLDRIDRTKYEESSKEKRNDALMEVMNAFLAKKPTFDELKRYRYAFPYLSGVISFLKNALPHTRTAKEFMELARQNREGLQSDWSLKIDEVKREQVKHFISLGPTAEEMRQFAYDEIYYYKEKISALRQILPHTKTAADFLLLAKSPWFKEYDETNKGQWSEVLQSHLKHFMSLRPNSSELVDLYYNATVYWTDQQAILKVALEQIKDSKLLADFVVLIRNDKQEAERHEAMDERLLANLTRFLSLNPDFESIRKIIHEGIWFWKNRISVLEKALGQVTLPSEMISLVTLPGLDRFEPELRQKLEDVILRNAWRLKKANASQESIEAFAKVTGLQSTIDKIGSFVDKTPSSLNGRFLTTTSTQGSNPAELKRPWYCGGIFGLFRRK